MRVSAARGLIPAHAGKTCNPPHRTEGGWAHPRSRGENREPCSPTFQALGSSPLTRGKLGNLAGVQGAQRLIPAHAGKTSPSSPNRSRGAAHPRSRGENAPMVRCHLVVYGSSPLTRGKLRVQRRAEAFLGLIPAHAGKTTWVAVCSLRPRAHPRSRGENASFLGAVVSSPGSSPLTRGKRVRRRLQQERDRLIPAHAGKTESGCRADACSAAHPRSRGENLIPGCLIAPGAGSSPLTRGKQSV